MGKWVCVFQHHSSKTLKNNLKIPLFRVMFLLYNVLFNNINMYMLLQVAQTAQYFCNCVNPIRTRKNELFVDAPPFKNLVKGTCGATLNMYYIIILNIENNNINDKIIQIPN